MSETASKTPRLRRQLDRVRELMLDESVWWTLAEIKKWMFMEFGVAASEASISARLRDLRKAKFGGYLVECRIRSGALREYRVTAQAKPLTKQELLSVANEVAAYGGGIAKLGQRELF